MGEENREYRGRQIGGLVVRKAEDSDKLLVAETGGIKKIKNTL